MTRTSLARLTSLVVAFGCASACAVEPDAIDDDAIDDGEGQADTAGCVVGTPPAALGLDPFYTKHCSAFGVPVIAAASVPDAAIRQAHRIVTAMLEPMPNVQQGMLNHHFRIGIIGADQKTTDMPEYRDKFPPSLNDRARALSDNPLTSTAEENVLCYELDGWLTEGILVHEFAHTIKGVIEFYAPDFDQGFKHEVQAAYEAALAKGLYKDLYASTSAEEYWAEGVQNYFEVHASRPGEPGPITSADLRAYDPTLWNIVDRVFRDVRMPPRCPRMELDPAATYRIQNIHRSTLAIDGAALGPIGTRATQAWRIRPLANGGFSITTRSGGQTRALAVVNGAVRLVAPSPGPAQTWRLTPIARGETRITNDRVGTWQSLAAPLTGNALVLEPTALRIVQRWNVTKVP